MMSGKSVSLIVAIVLTVIVLVAGCGPDVNPERTAPPLDADGLKKLQDEAEKVKAAEPEEDANDTDDGSQ